MTKFSMFFVQLSDFFPRNCCTKFLNFIRNLLPNLAIFFRGSWTNLIFFLCVWDRMLKSSIVSCDRLKKSLFVSLSLAKFSIIFHCCLSNLEIFFREHFAKLAILSRYNWQGSQFFQWLIDELILCWLVNWFFAKNRELLRK